MAVVGDAYIVVRALTNRVKPEIERAFAGLDSVGERAGKDISQSFSKGFAGGDNGGLRGLFGSKFDKDADRAQIKLRSLTQAGYFLGPALAAAGGAIGALGAGIVSLGAIAGAAAQGGLVVLGAGLFTLAQSAVALKLAFSGVGDALKAGLKPPKSSKELENAQERLKKALLAEKRILEDYPDERNRIIEQGVDLADAAAQAQLSSNRATRAYNEAQRSTKKALADVAKATEEATKKRKELRFEAEGGAISEKKARLEYEKSRENLQRVMDLPPNSRARQEAQIAYEEAELNLRKAVSGNKDLKAEVAKANREAVTGSEAEIAAVDSLRRAREAEGDAGIDAAQAAKDLAKAKAASAQFDADLASGKAFKDIDRRVADARTAVTEAQKDVREAGKGTVDPFAEAMKKLSPEAQRFVRYLISIQGEFKKLKAAAGKELFPKLETAIDNLVKNLFPKLVPLLEGTGKALGDAAIGISKVITKSENIKVLESVWKKNDILIGRFGKVIGNLYEGFINLIDAAWPLIDAFSQWAVDVTAAWSASVKLGNASNTLDEKFRRISEVLGGLGEAGGTFFDALKDIFAVIMEEGGAADVLVGYLKDAAQNFKDFTSAGREDGSLKEFFVRATENFTKVLDLIGNIVGELFKLGAAEGTGQFLDSLNEVVDIFGRIGEKLSGKDGAASGLGDFLVSIAKVTEALTDSGSIEMFFKVLTGAFEILAGFLKLPFVAGFLAIVGPILGVVKAVLLLRRGFLFVKSAIKGVLQSFVNIGRRKDPLTKVDLSAKNLRTRFNNLTTTVNTKVASAMKKVESVGNAAGRGLNRVRTAANNTRTALGKSTVAANLKAKAMRGVGTAGRIAGVGLKAAGRGLGALFGGPIGIILLLLPLIIENWDAIVAFFKDLIPKLGKIFSDMWGGLTKFLGEAWTNISKWWNETFIPGIIDFGKKALEVLAFILFPIPSLIIKFWPQISEFFTKTVFPWFASLPAKIGAFVAGIWDFFVKGVGIAWNAVVTYFTTIFNFYTSLPGRILNLAGKVWTFLSDGIKTAWNAVTGYVTGTLIPWVTGLPARFIKGAGVIWNFISSGIKTAWTAATGYVTGTLIPWLTGMPAKFGKALSSLWSGLSNGLQAAWATAKKWWNDNVASKKLTIGGFKVLGVQIPKIELGFPKLAKGGIIPATPGGTMAMIGEAGRAERVEPLDPNGLSQRDKAMIDYMGGGAGTTINVYPSAGMDERELADLVSRKLAQSMRRGAA
jgi:hypothetical protein